MYSVADALHIFRIPDVEAMWPIPLRISDLVEAVVNNVCYAIDGFAVLDTPETFKFCSRLPKPKSGHWWSIRELQV